MEHNTSLDDTLNHVENEFSYVDTILNEFLFGAQSQLSTHVGKSEYLNDTIISTDQIELSSTFSSKNSSSPNTSEKFELVVKGPLRTSIDMASNMNHPKGSPNNGPCDSSPGIRTNSLQTHVEGQVPNSSSSFCNGQSTYASSNGSIYQMLNTAVCI
jgi:hypothetical protein